MHLKLGLCLDIDDHSANLAESRDIVRILQRSLHGTSPSLCQGDLDFEFPRISEGPLLRGPFILQKKVRVPPYSEGT